MFHVVEETFEVDGRSVSLETGRLARQADGAVLVRQGDAAVLVTAVIGADEKPARDGDDEFVPLTVEYREKLAAAGRIPGSFLRREARISDDEILVSRILDRSLRPLFPKGIAREIQVQATVLSAEPKRIETALLALIGASAALHLSSIPWSGPIAGARLVRSDGRWIAFPDPAERAHADVDLVVSVRREGLVMVEGGAEQVSEAVVLEGLELAGSKLTRLLAAIEKLREKAGRPKLALAPPAETAEQARVAAEVDALAPALLAPAFAIAEKHARRAAIAAAQKDVVARALAGATASGAPAVPDAKLAAFAAARGKKLTDRLIRERVLAEGRRLDGRGPGDIRPIDCQVGWLAGPHGSALFTRGETQAMVTCTLGPKDVAQEVETLAGMESRPFLLHYNFPPYSVGEVRPLRGPGRREIGHGNLARRALVPVLPPFTAFPYVIRVESDISESNGSSSMATTCGGCLALMDAGVPIAAMVAGIAMGLVSDSSGPGGAPRYQVLSDILGDEDHLGDMDFKVTGTERGVTAVQMDNKVGSLPREVLARALEQAAAGRRHILGEMKKALAAPRAALKDHAPRVTSVRIAPAAIPELIGPRGANLKEIRAQLGAEVTIDDAGYAFVYANDAARARAAVARVRELAGVVQAGKLYRGRVTGVKEFGAFVAIFRSAEGLVHVSEWDAQRTNDMNAVAREGDEVLVRVLGVDDRGKLRLSRKEALGSRGEEVVNA
jgi:polyribonucleotide nucleotidyltransferase